MEIIRAKSTTTFKHKWDNETSYTGNDEEGKAEYEYDRDTYVIAECRNYEITKGFKKFKMELKYYLATDKEFIDDTTNSPMVTTIKQLLPRISKLNYSKDIDTISFYRSKFGSDIPKEKHFGEGLVENTSAIFLAIVNKEAEYGLQYELF